jgi:hypothetical protein
MTVSQSDIFRLGLARASSGSAGAAGIYLPGVGRVPIGEVGSSGADVLASKQFPYLWKMTRKALNVSTFPSSFGPTPTGGTEIYVDFNRGNDTNAGTRAAPKKNLSALSGQTYGAGTIIALASDSQWDIVATQAAHNAVNADNWVGSSGNPILITSYDAAGHTGTKPTITYGYYPASSEWTWDATMNAWRWSPTQSGMNPDATMAVFFGPSKLHGIDVVQDPNNKTLSSYPLFADLQFTHKTDYNTVQNVWVYAPSNTDPTTYYGSVMISLTGRGAFKSAWTGLSNTIIDGIKFQNTACGIWISVGANSGANVHTGLVIKNCELYRAGLLFWKCNEVAAHSFTINNNKGTDLPAGLVKLAGVGTLAYNVYSNSVVGCNRQYSGGGAFYVQTTAASLGAAKLHHNYVYDAWNGVATELNTNGRSGYGFAYDGSAYYFDLGGNNNLAYANISERCHVAAQTNSAKTVMIIGHIALDCNVLSTSTDAGHAGSNDVTIAHCTYINHLIDVNQLKRGTTSRPELGISNWFETATSSAIRVYNNALWRQYQVTGMEAIRIANEAPTKFVAGNAISGWSGGSTVGTTGIAGAYAVSRAIDGSAISDISSTAININGGLNAAMDGATWFDGSTAALAANSPLYRAGVRYLDGLLDASGSAFSKMPSIGAMEAAAL